MSLTDAQMMLLEQITYAGDVFDALGCRNAYPKDALKKIQNLSKAEIDSIRKMEKIGTIPGNEWADIITAIQNDPSLMALECRQYDENSKGYCFVSKTTGEAYVAFKGTTGAEEWIDDALGLYMADTPYQKYALDFIEDLEYDHIGVVGHSKGGNKAQYVAILSDKVDHCVSLDGQGFSKEFIDKYWAEIEQRGGNITSYAYSSDYVHILLNYVPGAEMIILSGTNTGAECHNPNAFFTINGKSWEVSYTEAPENPMMTYLHEFTCFVSNNMSKEDRQKVGWYLGALLAICLADYTVSINGITYNKDNVIDFLLSDSDCGSTILAWLLKYVKVNNLSKEEVMGLLNMFGIKGFQADLIWILAQAVNVNDDPASILSTIKTFLDIPGVDAREFEVLVNQTIKKYSQITTDGKNAGKDYRAKCSSKNRDFSNNSLNVICSAIDSINSMTFDDVSSWPTYAGEEWYGFLSTGVLLNGINNYNSKLYAVNAKARSAINSVYQTVYDLDVLYSQLVQTELSTITAYHSSLRSLIDNIGK